MTATAEGRATKRRDGRQFVHGVANNSNIPTGVIISMNTSGYVVNGRTSTVDTCLGVSTSDGNNTGLGDGVTKITWERGTWGPFANSASGDLITLADVGKNCYLVDNQTVAKTSGTNTRVVAGVVRDVDADGVWVQF